MLAALEVMRPTGAGHVINIASVAGLAPAPDLAIYSATKRAIVGLSVNTQLDLQARGETVRMSCVCPDGIWTPMTDHAITDPRAAASFAGVILEPETVADRVG